MDDKRLKKGDSLNTVLQQTDKVEFLKEKLRRAKKLHTIQQSTSSSEQTRFHSERIDSTNRFAGKTFHNWFALRSLLEVPGCLVLSEIWDSRR